MPYYGGDSPAYVNYQFYYNEYFQDFQEPERDWQRLVMHFERAYYHYGDSLPKEPAPDGIKQVEPFHNFCEGILRVDPTIAEGLKMDVGELLVR